MGQYPEKPWCIFMVPADGGTAEQVTDGENGTGYDPTWSPDGKSLAVGGSPSVSSVIHVLNVTTHQHVLNVTTHQLSVLPGSKGLFSPRWSPNGRYICAISNDTQLLLLFDFQSQKWTELAKGIIGYPSWSRDSEHIYFSTFGPNATFFRVGIKDRKLQRVVSLKDFARALGTLGPWSGLGTDDSPLFERDASLDEIYALDWEAP
jgi:Tol biopolymer transport system component